MGYNETKLLHYGNPMKREDVFLCLKKLQKIKRIQLISAIVFTGETKKDDVKIIDNTISLRVNAKDIGAR